MPDRKLKLITEDPWLLPSKHAIQDRYQRYADRLFKIKQDFGSLSECANAYSYYGLHYNPIRKGWSYREWAPGAHAMFLCGDFNDWNKYEYPLRRNNFGVWETFIPDAGTSPKIRHKDTVKVLVRSSIGEHFKIPAYIRRAIQDEQSKNFTGQVWIDQTSVLDQDNFSFTDHDNLLIYECHVGMAQEKEGVGSYTEFRENILPRIKEAGYNAIQLMAIQEHPYYGSFGYHVSNFYAPSSRFGTPEELKKLILAAHEMDIAVILDIANTNHRYCVPMICFKQTCSLY